MGPLLTDATSRKVIFVSGKGGVGKTTYAMALASALSLLNKRVAIAMMGTIPNSFQLPGVTIHSLTAERCFKEYALRVLKFEKVYDKLFDNKVLKSFVRAAPGLKDTVIAGKIWDLVEKDLQDHLIVDLPSTGHAIHFFQSPMGVSKLFPVGFVHNQSEKISQLFLSEKIRIDLIIIPTEFAVTEVLELYQKLCARGPFHFGYLIKNQCLDLLNIPLKTTPTLQPLVDRYFLRKNLEEDALAGVRQLPLTQVTLPLIADSQSLIHELSQRLQSL